MEDIEASTELMYNNIQINEHIMKDVNYTSQHINLSIDEKNNLLLPKEYHLSQNYPNPFNPTTYIRYNIPYYDNIIIEIFNIKGQIIKSIVQKI